MVGYGFVGLICGWGDEFGDRFLRLGVVDCVTVGCGATLKNEQKVEIESYNGSPCLGSHCSNGKMFL